MTKKIKLSTDARRLLSALAEAEFNDPEGVALVRERVYCSPLVQTTY
jgi:hypothetical protein